MESRSFRAHQFFPYPGVDSLQARGGGERIQCSHSYTGALLQGPTCSTAQRSRHFSGFGGRANLGPGNARFNKFSNGFLLKRTPFTDAEVHAIDAFLGLDEKGEVTRLYTPLDPPGGTIYQRLLAAADARTVYAAEQQEIAPATDNQPFFNQHTR